MGYSTENIPPLVMANYLLPDGGIFSSKRSGFCRQGFPYRPATWGHGQ